MPNLLRAFDALVEKRLGIYVYALIDPYTKRIFYVGKGGEAADHMGNSRLFEHFSEAEIQANDSAKCQTIRAIWARGEDVEWRILRYDIGDPDLAYQIEASIIDALAASPNGRPDNDIDGHGKEEHGSLLAGEALALGAQPVNPQLPRTVFVFSIYKALKRLLDEEKSWEDAVYEATRRAWSLGQHYTGLNDCVAVGLVDGVSFGAYAIIDGSWRQCSLRIIKLKKENKTRAVPLYEFDKSPNVDAGLEDFRYKDWTTVLHHVDGYRKRSGGTVIVSFDGLGQFQYLRPTNKRGSSYQC